MSLRLRSSIASRDHTTEALRRLGARRAVKDDERRRFEEAVERLGLGSAATLSPVSRTVGPCNVASQS